MTTLDDAPGQRSMVATLVDLCASRAAADPDRGTWVYLGDGATVSETLSLGELDRAARAIAVALRLAAPPGARVLLSYGPGLAFIPAFFGCLYAGMIAVPIAPVDNGVDEGKTARTRSIIDSSGAQLLLGQSTALAALDPEALRRSGLDALTAIASDTVDPQLAEQWGPPEITAESVAYLQYSSGSTGQPKGVVITHRNVLSNLELIHENGARDDGQNSAAVVLWLPLFHDMGLVNAVLQPLFVGFDAVLMSSMSFVQRPINWLRAIASAGLAISVAPNIAFELCLRRTTPEQRAELDLSGWHLAAVGAEPVRAETLDAFCAAFGPSGFRREAFFPCYGLAEATVMVSGGPTGSAPVVLDVDARELARGRVAAPWPGARSRKLVGCGQIQDAVRVVLVDPATGRQCAPDEVGEIYVSSASVGGGYWQRPEATEETFAAAVEGLPGVAFLRTGDLGFLAEGQLFVTGRLKDVVILGGLNYYPSDLERTASGAHRAVREGFCCAFSVDDGRRERLVVLVEIAGSHRAGGALPPPGEVELSVRRAITAEHGVQTGEVVLLRSATLPFTSSAKLQRIEARRRFLAGELATALLS